MFATQSSKLGGQIASRSPRSGPVTNTESLALRLARESRFMADMKDFDGSFG